MLASPSSTAFPWLIYGEQIVSGLPILYISGLCCTYLSIWPVKGSIHCFSCVLLATIIVEFQLTQSQTTKGKENASNESPVLDEVPVVQRIPTSELSFFRSLHSTDSSASSKSRPIAHSSRTNPGFSDSFNLRPLSMSLSSQGFKTLFHALPLLSNDAPSSRTSFDTSEGSSTSYVSEASSDQEHEMEVLKSAKRERTPTQRSPRRLSTNPHYPPYHASVVGHLQRFYQWRSRGGRCQPVGCTDRTTETLATNGASQVHKEGMSYYVAVFDSETPHRNNTSLFF